MVASAAMANRILSNMGITPFRERRPRRTCQCRLRVYQNAVFYTERPFFRRIGPVSCCKRIPPMKNRKRGSDSL